MMKRREEKWRGEEGGVAGKREKVTREMKRRGEES